MKFKYILSIGGLALATTAGAQTYDWRPDTLATGVGYADDAYFNLDNGQIKTEPNNNWDLAFPGAAGSMMRHTIITNNYGNGLSGKLVELTGKSGSADFATDLTADTAGKTAITNIPETWEEGAFGLAMGGSNPTWGVYDVNTHNIDGDKIYAYINNNGAYQIWIEQFQARANAADRLWKFHIANLDGTDDTTIEFKPHPDFVDEHLAYFSLDTREFINRDPSYGSWHLLATKYGDFYGTSGQILGTTGIVSAPTVVVAAAIDLVPEDEDYEDYENAYSEDRNVIGGTYKTLNGSFQWEVYDSLSYFIKSVYGEDTGDIWQIYFDYFPPATSGDVKIGAQVRKVFDFVKDTTNSINAIDEIFGNVVIAPNPTVSGSTNILIDANQDINNAAIIITDISGRVVRAFNKNITKGFHQLRLDTSNFAEGLYLINIQAGGLQQSHKLMVK